MHTCMRTFVHVYLHIVGDDADYDDRVDLSHGDNNNHNDDAKSGNDYSDGGAGGDDGDDGVALVLMNAMVTLLMMLGTTM